MGILEQDTHYKNENVKAKQGKRGKNMRQNTHDILGNWYYTYERA